MFVIIQLLTRHIYLCWSLSMSHLPFTIFLDERFVVMLSNFCPSVLCAVYYSIYFVC